MLSHYVKVSFRELLKYRTQSIVSIIGLAVGFTAFILGGYLYGGGWVEKGFSHESWTHDNSFDWGLSFQAGLEIGSCVMNVGYDASLGKEYEYDSVDLKYHTFSLSVGYKFKLGK